MRKVDEIQKDWSAESIEQVQKILDDSAEVLFKAEHKVNGDHYFGELTLRTHSGSEIEVSTILKSLNHTVKSEHFLDGK